MAASSVVLGGTDAKEGVSRPEVSPRDLSRKVNSDLSDIYSRSSCTSRGEESKMLEVPPVSENRRHSSGEVYKKNDVMQLSCSKSARQGASAAAAAKS